MEHAVPPVPRSRLMAAGEPPRIPVLGVGVDAVGMGGAVERIAGWVAEARAGGQHATRQVVTLNPEMVMAARRDAGFGALVRTADLVTPDGVGILWAARLQGWRLPERVTGVELVEVLAARAALEGWRLFLLGAVPGVAEDAAAALRSRFPGLMLASTYAGSPAAADEADALARIQVARADLVFVAYGAPAQERWIARNRARLGAAAAIGVGGALDFAAGRMPRAPRWMRRLGLEWLYRLIRQPWRWRRMLALPRFALLALGEMLVTWLRRAARQLPTVRVR